MSTGGAARMRACGRVRRWRPRAPRERFGVPRRARAGAAITHHTVTPSMNASAILATLLCTALAAPLAAQHAPAAHWPERAVRRDIPLGPMIRRAYAAGTRDSTGAPGARYWQQSVDYAVDGTVATVHPASPVLPGATAAIDVDWEFEVPDVPTGKRGERMGRWGHELYQVAQWYPQVAMYDDLRGWDTDQYLGTAEFYNQYGSFDVKITLPS